MNFLLQYNTPSLNLSIIPFTDHLYPWATSFKPWGHSLETIDTSSTFRLILQNPNGLSLHAGTYSTHQDLFTYRELGAACLTLPETNTNK